MQEGKCQIRQIRSLQFVCQKDYTKATKLHFTKLLGVVKHRQKKEKPNKFGVKLENGKLAQGFSP